ncbi:phosphate signaling complex protein PhoU [Thermoactinomyces mirandus]|uniref:Phosphate-specific transport system accessory protein PhoU n=1 Tax=Thermoactinomyces mirandus TaxID=2756294 RepID=A0A7W1XQV0_9BACL|nr:phosphate signaling complex protein PhoU [Thermoactinomyces mirandus]MBA4601614.1 phosphate signaling complex protein PhoU [Thermoactinomyces mirandus]
MAARQFDQSLGELKKKLLKMGEQVEISINKSIKSFVKRDVQLAREIIELDCQIDELKVEIDDTVTKLIATRQPVATDLRKLIAAMNIASDLERMADLAVDIAEEVVALEESNQPRINNLSLILQMAQMTQQMVNDGLNSYIDGNIDLARMLARRDDQVDQMYEKVVREMSDYMPLKNQYADAARKVCFVARFLERIADHVTNIAENIVYIQTGKRIDLN